MIIRTQHDGFVHPLGSEITPHAAYFEHDRWLAQSALALGSAWCWPPSWAGALGAGSANADSAERFF